MRENVTDNKTFPCIFKGVAIAIIITLIGILIFAFIIKVAYLNSSVIKAVNQFIKVISIFLGCFMFIRQNKGIIKGGLIGCFSAVITYLIFAFMGGELNFGAGFILDVIFQVVIGIISGIIAVNVKK